jgi:peptidoglycan/xylan/chitin deacetylase (PgdA/CDA1 family)
VSSGLYLANHPARFWQLRLSPEPSESSWQEAARTAASVLPDRVSAGGAGIEQLLARTLGEEQFGAGHWSLGFRRRAYYRLKPVLPRALIVRMRRLHRRSVEGADAELAWPIEDRYARFLWSTAGHLLEHLGQPQAPFLFFWPEGRSLAFVLTHDIETAQGQAFVPEVARLEEDLGFRSSFNFVAERYPLDHGLIRDLKERGFEVGVHGLKHDGRLFSSRAEFERRAQLINGHLRALDAVGFRSPLTHRNPEWMQSLDIEYDLSFFDSDPFEPIPGGTMSIWPFTLGRFLELPYTLAQDFTLTQVLGERSPRLWLEKVDFLARFFGMALVNAHPDYLQDRSCLSLYRDFLEAVGQRDDCWHALPKDVARWWRGRATPGKMAPLPGAVDGIVHREEGGWVTITVPLAKTRSADAVVAAPNSSRGRS